MSRKIFYFVRHGESLMNAAGLRQGAEGSLSEKGQRQAMATGKRLANYSFEIILASPYVRTRETADIINQNLNHPRKIEYVDLLHERKNPSEIVNKSVDDVEVRKITDIIDRSYHDDNYRYSDEENFVDLKERAKNLLAYLASRPEQSVLCVTHGIFLRMIAAYILYGDSLDAKTYNVLSFLNDEGNAAINVCEYIKPWFSKPRWELLAWDDYTRDSPLIQRAITSQETTQDKIE